MTLDAFKHFIGDIARPVSIIATSVAASISIVVLSFRIAPEGLGIAAYVGAMMAGVAGLYWGRAWENARTRAPDQPQG